jgi:hypothetical protein
MITITRAGAVAVVVIQPFSETALKAVKSIKSRQWDEVRHCWEIPVVAVESLARQLYAQGEGVLIGEPYEPFDPLTDARPNVLLPLFQALPPHLRQRVFTDLGMALGPGLYDSSGDPDLFDQLHTAFKAVQAADKVAERVAQAKADRRQPKAQKKPQPVRPVRVLVRRQVS